MKYRLILILEKEEQIPRSLEKNIYKSKEVFTAIKAHRWIEK